ncbi:MAG TPA: hypothetical protein VFC23_04840 [Thermoanaerobaculia bacterium]|nr:hypothetical protein [Thermoanaerobaculia bacterium]
MKRPSATKPSLSLPELVFFTDRDLGKVVPRLLRENGLAVEWYFDHFAEGARVADNEWLLYAAQRRWIALSHDDNIRRDPEAIRTIMESSGRLFILRGALPPRELAGMFLESIRSVVALIKRHDQAFIANVRRSAHQGGLLRAAAHLMLTFEEWTAGREYPDEV